MNLGKWKCSNRSCQNRDLYELCGIDRICKICGAVQSYNPLGDFTVGKLTMCERESYGRGSIRPSLPPKLIPIFCELSNQVDHIDGAHDMPDGLLQVLVDKSKEVLMSCCGPGGEDGSPPDFLFPIPRNIHILTTAAMLIASRECSAFRGTLTECILNSVKEPCEDFEKRVLALKNDILTFRARRKHIKPSSEINLLEDTARRECNTIGLMPRTTEQITKVFMDLTDRVVCNGQNPRFVLAGVIEHIVVQGCSKSVIKEELDIGRKGDVHDLLLGRLKIKEKLLMTIDSVIAEDHGCR